MTKSIQWGFLVALVLGFVFLWHQVPLPCEKPLHYNLGTFDNRFGISQDDFLKEVAAAEKVWEDALQKELFQYDAAAVFHVNLIFDIRQEQTLEANKLETSLEKTQTTQETIEEKQKRTLALYQDALQGYERMLALFTKRLAAYNAEVEKWNKKGGAPKEEYENLQEVAASLEKDQKTLEVKRQEVNRLANQVNSFSKEKVALVNEYNAQVEDYVDRYGEGGDPFDQGVYTGKEMNIYQYEDLPHLRAVLVHEFGHALGLEHGSDPKSIMYPLMKDQKVDPVTLSDEDKQMIMAQCSQNTWDILFKRISALKKESI